MLIHENYVVLETRIEVRLKPQMDNHGVVMAADVGLSTI